VYTNALRSALDIIPKKTAANSRNFKNFMTSRVSELVTLKTVLEEHNGFS